MADNFVYNAWKCVDCGHIGRESEFVGHICPKCQSEDAFPHRTFKCKTCGTVADQDSFFPDMGLDDHPVNDFSEPIPAICPNEDCPSYVPDGEDGEYDEEATVEVEEIAVDLSSVQQELHK